MRWSAADQRTPLAPHKKPQKKEIPRPPRVNAAILSTMKTMIGERTTAPPPTHREICAFARILAREEKIEDPAKLALLEQPEKAPSRAEDELLFCWYEDYLKRAKYLLCHPEERLSPEKAEILYDCRTAPPTKKPKPGRYPPAPEPTFEQVCEFARVLAMDDGMLNRDFLRLISWRSGERLKMAGRTFAKYQPKAWEYRHKAREGLAERMRSDHRNTLRRLHRAALRKKERAYRWTRKPQDAPVPQRRGPPRWLTERTNERARAHSPPGQAPPAEPSLERPDGCDREEPLSYPGGGHWRGVLRRRTRWNPLPQCAATFLGIRIANRVGGR